MSKKDEFLKNQKILHLATVNKTGMPHIVPVWYMYMNKKILIGTNTKTEKAKNVKNHKKVSCCVEVGVHAPNIFGVMGKGNAKLMEMGGTPWPNDLNEKPLASQLSQLSQTRLKKEDPAKQLDLNI